MTTRGWIASIGCRAFFPPKMAADPVVPSVDWNDVDDDVPECEECNGSGECKECYGCGDVRAEKWVFDQWIGRMYEKGWFMDCRRCNASGNCRACGGTGTGK